LKLERCAEYYGQIEREAALQPLRMAPKSEAAREAVVEEARGVAEATSIELENARILLGTLIGEELPGAPDDPPPPEAEEARKLVPKRNAWRIPEEKLLGAKARKALAELRARPECKGVNFADVWPWADGRRSLYNIWRRLRYKRVYPLQAMIDFFKIMAKARVVRFVKREA
jgi:hypothetical protein